MKQSVNMMTIMIIGIILALAVFFFGSRSADREVAMEKVKQITEVSAFASIDYSVRVDEGTSTLDKKGFEQSVLKGVSKRLGTIVNYDKDGDEYVKNSNKAAPGKDGVKGHNVYFEYDEVDGQINSLMVAIEDCSPKSLECAKYTSSQRVDNTKTELSDRVLITYDTGVETNSKNKNPYGGHLVTPGDTFTINIDEGNIPVKDGYTFKELVINGVKVPLGADVVAPSTNAIVKVIWNKG